MKGVLRVDNESAQLLTVLKLVDAESSKFDCVFPVLVARLVCETSDAHGLPVFTPGDLVGKVDGKKLFVNDGLDGLLANPEALGARLLHEHAQDAILVDGQSHLKFLSDGTVGG